MLSSSRRLRAHELAFCYAALLLTAYYLVFPPSGYGRIMDAKYICFLALSGVFFLLFALSRPSFPQPDALDAAVLLFAVLVLLSALLSPYGTAALLGGSRRQGALSLLLYAASFLLLRRFLRPDGRLALLAAVALLLCDALIFLQLAGCNPLRLYPEGLTYYDGDLAYSGFYAGVSGNADFTAALLSLGVCGLGAYALRRRKPLCLLALLPTLAALWLLHVSAALLGLAVSALLSLPLLLPRRRALAFSLSLALLALSLLALRLIPFPSGALHEAHALLCGQADGSFGSGRLAIWRELLPRIAQRPLLGSGPDTLHLMELSPIVWEHDGARTALAVTSAHNEYLSLLLHVGIPATLLAVGTAFASLLHSFRHASEPAAAVGGCMLLCYLVQAFFLVDTCITVPYGCFAAALCWYERRTL